MLFGYGGNWRMCIFHSLSRIQRQMDRYFSVKFYKHQVYKGYLLYLILTYRLAKKPKKFMTNRWPGRTGAIFGQESGLEPIKHIPHPRTLEKMCLPEVLKKTNSRSATEDLKFSADANLLGLKFLILGSGYSINNHNLQALSISIKELLESLGGLCFSATTQDFPNRGRGNLLDGCDFIVCDQNITRLELERVLENSPRIALRANKVKIVLLCYDLWRDKDKIHIDSIKRYIDIFLHHDSIMMEKSFSDIVHKSFTWPLSRAWSCANVSLDKLRKQEDRIFFSGNASEYDRRQILDSVIDATKTTNLKPRFRLGFSRLPSLFEDNQKYKSELQQNRCILSPTQKGERHWIVTGRTIDTLGLPNSGVLLQQEGVNCRPLAKILTPYRDYLPFTNQEELHEIIRWCDENSFSANQISQNGYTEFRRLYSPNYLSGIFLNC